MAIIVILRMNVDLVDTVSLEEVVEEPGPLAAPHDHPQVHRPVLFPDTVGSGDQPPVTYKTCTTEGGGP